MPTEGPSSRAYAIFAVTALALLMSSLDTTIVAVAVPTLLVDLKTNLALIGWTLTGYQLTSTIIMPLAGKLSDDWGRKRLFLGAVVLFTLSSMAAGLSPNIYFLIVFRVLQAVGGGAFLPSATGIVSDAFGNRRATAIGLFTSVFPLGGILGPNIGGFIIDSFSWRWIFYVNVPIGIALVVLGMAILPGASESTAGAAVGRRRVDLVGAGLFAGGMLGFLYALTAWAQNPDALRSPSLWLSLAVGATLIGWFLRHESRTPAPMVEIELLKWRPFFAANLYNFLYGAAVFGMFSFIPYYATVGYGMSAGQDGAILTPRSMSMAVMSTVSSFLLVRFGYRRPMVLGAVLITVSLFLLSRGFHDVTLLGVAVPNIVLIAGFMMIAGIGMGIGGPAANNAALDLVPEKVAAVAGLRGMFRSTGGVLGTAGIVVALSYSPDKAVGMQHIFIVLAVLTLAVIPIVFMIPDRGDVIERGTPAAPPPVGAAGAAPVGSNGGD